MTNPYTPKTLVGKKMQARSSIWTQGFADGYCEGYDHERGVYFFALLNARRDEPRYEVRSHDAGMFTILTDDDGDDSVEYTITAAR